MQKYIGHDMWRNGTPTSIAFPIATHGLFTQGMEVNVFTKKEELAYGWWIVDYHLLNKRRL